MAQRYNKWTDYEDHALEELVQKYGQKNWTQISRKLKICYQISKRNGKQCRQRWHNRLSKSLNILEWSQEEDRLLLSLQTIYGNRWINITHHFKGRSDNQIKNHFYSIIRKSIRRMCKLIEIKTNSMNIYSIKPYTISQIFYLGGEEQTKRESNVSQRTSLQMKVRLNRDYCNKIVKIIIFYIFADKGQILYISEQRKEEIRWVLYKIRQINSFYQNQMIQENSHQNSSQYDSQLEKNQKQEKLEVNQRQMEKPRISQNQFSEQQNSQNQLKNYGIFSQTKEKGSLTHNQIALEIIESANMLGGIKPYFQQWSQQISTPALDKLQSKLSLQSCISRIDIKNQMFDEDDLYFSSHLMEYETPIKSVEDIYKQSLL